MEMRMVKWRLWEWMKIFFSVCFSACCSGLLDDLGVTVTSRSGDEGTITSERGRYVVVKTGVRAGCILWLKSIKCVARHLRSLSNSICQTIYRSVIFISQSNLRFLQDSRRICQKRDIFRQPQTKIPPTARTDYKAQGQTMLH